jgi:hypothetical protein
MTLRFWIDDNIDDAESNRRHVFEGMFKKKKCPVTLTCADLMHVVLSDKGYLFMNSDLYDQSHEYNSYTKDDNVSTEVLLQRDWTQKGFLYAAYRVKFVKKGVGRFYTRVRTMTQMERAIDRWREIKRAKMMSADVDSD